MTQQLELFSEASDEYIPDRWIVGNRKPRARHYDSENAQMRRPFVMWDGEGYNDTYGTHHYWLLANSAGDKLVAPIGRSLERHNIARFFLECHAKYGNAIHCGFALGYDFTCILRGNGLATSQYASLYTEQILREPGYVFRLMMGKQLSVWENGVENKNRMKFNLQDGWGFFQRSFVKALDEYFGENWKYRDVIVEMKQQRGSFDREHDDNVMQYNDMELEVGVELFEELRDRLYQSGMPISRWYGPGAIANGLMQRWHIKSTLVDYYNKLPQLSRASQHGYAGGRFELFKPGKANQPVYQYDINSAYPYAIAQMPNLARGSWEHIEKPTKEQLTDFSLVRVKLDSALAHYNLSTGEAPRNLGEVYPESIPFPLWRRHKNGRMSWPSFGVHGWYYAPELFAAMFYCSKLPEFYDFKFELEEAWVFRPDNPMYYYTLKNSSQERNGQIWTDFSLWNKLDPWIKEDILPFSHVPVMYDNRLKLKRLGNGAHIGIKLALNSLYGKFAQQIGYNEKTKQIPPYHNLVLAGWVTAMCRAMLLRAMALNPHAIIATETDGIFSLAELDLPIGSGLGQWERTQYDDMYYFASGFRFGITAGEVQKPATRGIPARDISLDKIKQNCTDNLSTIAVQASQFITINWASAMNRTSETGNWRTLTKELSLMCEDPHGKRIHDWDCPSCEPVERADGATRVYDWTAPHVTIPAQGEAYGLSVPHPVAWVSGDTGQANSDIDTDVLFEV